ncbi:Uncharacterized protein TCM_040575 [Theobroma cacao]|uniref:Uncharacterized protein n=1 Tax=Theobroma cacao TaxID=3641 RepID=A0A061GT41_THECC|nr:Uncharacterized protein TCM_040575 [Theobroma cacao]
MWDFCKCEGQIGYHGKAQHLFFIFNHKSFNKYSKHITSQEMDVIALYSAFVELLATIVCFLDFQLIKDGPRNMLKPVKKFLLLGHLAQSSST